MTVTETQRRWVYGIVIAALPILAAYGVLGPDEAPMWVALAAAALGVGSSSVAAAHVGESGVDDYQVRHRAEE